MTSTRLFKNGNSQAVRIPAELAFPSNDMELVIERQVLDILSTLCQADIPPGLRPHIIRVFIFFMTHIKQTILPYVGVYLPIR
jgi:hypothetical protein